jgi:hypothetical protein
MNTNVLIGGSITAVALIVFTSFTSVSSYEIATISHSINSPYDEYFFENVNVLSYGRCRCIGSTGDWIGGLFIGNMSRPFIQAFDTPLERLSIIIYNDSISDPYMSFSKLINTEIYLHDADGIFFWSAWNQFGARVIPPLLLVWCYAEKLSIYIE